MNLRNVVSWGFVVVCLATAGYVLGTRLPPALAQQRSIKAALNESTLIMQKLQPDGRFAQVCFHSALAGNRVYISAHGVVASQEALRALRDQVAAVRPVFAVLGDVHVGQMSLKEDWPALAWKIDPSNQFPEVTAALQP